MTKATDMEQDAALSAAEFYDELAGEYDQMTGFVRRFAQERPFFSFLVKRYGIGCALDAGTGTGFHALLLTQLGVRMSAADISSAMLRRLTHHAGELGVHVETIHADLAELPQSVTKKYDAVFCLGNTLPHLLSDEALTATLLSFRRVLHPRGVLFLQILNYERILDTRERVQSIKEMGGVTYVRFYDYLADRLRFNVLRMEAKEGAVIHKLTSTELRPLVRAELSARVIDSGFPEMETYGGISLEEFRPEESRDLFVIAHAADDTRALR